ncbi:cation:proton antiporter [Thermococcus sp. GR6]|nr:proton-conducting transporter membrane subunit [Thermococcus sp. GR6]NJE41963.1 cation:proton antiporter [Thermococcus sp. GR6]
MGIEIIPIVPLGFAFFLPFLGMFIRSKRFFNAYSLIASGITAYLSWGLMKMAYSSEEPLVYAFGNWIAPIGIVFEVDRMGALLVFTSSVLFLLAIIYSFDYMRSEHGLQYYYTALLGLESGILGAFMTGDAFNLFVMLEVIGASSYSLVAFYRSRSESIEAAFKYAIMGSTATSLYFLSMGIVYSSLRTLNMADLAAKFHSIEFPVTGSVDGDVGLAIALFFALALAAFLVKSANFPGHFWLPDAHPAAPSPVSALLSGLVVAVAVYAVARFLYTVFPVGGELGKAISSVLLLLGASSAFLGSFMMLVQRDLKRLIAYSTIMHMGYLFMGLGVMSLTGLMAVIYHIVNHAIGKTLLFLAAGSFIHAAGTRNIEEMAGIGKNMPITSAAFGIATLALVGIPPLNTFFSKMLIYDALVEKSFWLGIVVIVTSAVAGWAYFQTFATLWRGKASEGHHEHNEEHEKHPHGHEEPYMAFVLVVLVLAVVIVGILSPILIDHFAYPAAEQAVDYNNYIGAIKRLAESLLSDGH